MLQYYMIGQQKQVPYTYVTIVYNGSTEQDPYVTIVYDWSTGADALCYNSL